MIRHGGKHDIYHNPSTGASQPVPRHREIISPVPGPLRSPVGIGFGPEGIAFRQAQEQETAEGEIEAAGRDILSGIWWWRTIAANASKTGFAVFRSVSTHVCLVVFIMGYCIKNLKKLGMGASKVMDSFVKGCFTSMREACRAIFLSPGVRSPYFLSPSTGCPISERCTRI